MSVSNKEITATPLQVVAQSEDVPTRVRVLEINFSRHDAVCGERHEWIKESLTDIRNEQNDAHRKLRDELGIYMDGMQRTVRYLIYIGAGLIAISVGYALGRPDFAAFVFKLFGIG